MTYLIKGSLSAVSRATNTTLAESFLNVDALIVVDVSASMTTKDVVRERQQVSRWDEARRQLEMLQASLPGRIALVAFSDDAFFCPGGNLPSPISSTDMVAALKFIKPVDGCGIRLILISDGEPDNPDGTLKLAAQFESKIDTIYIGGDEYGRSFLQKLSAATGGIAVKSSAKLLPELASNVRKLIGA